MKYILFCDGGARGNPGPAALGFVIQDTDGNTLFEYGEYLGKQTNNVAEYSALISALQKAQEMGADTVECRLDSKLVVEQLLRNWKVKEPHLQKLFMKAWNLLQGFKTYTLIHIPREKNTQADAQVNKTLDNLS
ncbi:MAG: ribonuclease H [Candidatus Magasanikbacteria bacterium CG11_big_fil_rev_8_21_14_0_20_39_34]|uniref:Ribonuclease H n=1 Tax=Candidatus Magasanikbacteria bacterium CG11_big_fil_rev_8_21_14_0_20_39_34 TaxID=1974653 RepID=A0A2H0N4T5_9BACT|nr:MAG: ribonuclease H [Candidatus Magasanikbacteria bacterium CG11_big_fil_rev_8_21_14_0_20_39_34]